MQNQKTSYDFCGIGNAGIDIISEVDAEFLKSWDLQKGICSYIDLETANKLQQGLQQLQFIPGGCAANVAACISSLGGQSAFIGRLAHDQIGALFLGDLQQRGIHYNGIPVPALEKGSTRIFTLITPDGERSFAAYYGVQEDLSPDDLDEGAIRQSRFFYLDGYALNARQGPEAFIRAAQISSQAGNTVVFAPSDLSILTKFRDTVSEIIKVSDIILCNEAEALLIAGASTIPDALAVLRDWYPMGAITMGEQGALVFDQNQVMTLPPAARNHPIANTNGAGDHFAGGFLYGLSKGYGLEKSCILGNMCAAEIIIQPGARPVNDYRIHADTLIQE